MSKEPSQNLTLRTLFAAVRPVAYTAVRLGVPLRQMKKLVEMAYFQEARNGELRMREITQVMSVSMAKAAQLSKQLKEFHTEPERAHDLRRRVLMLVWSEPQTRQGIANSIEDADERAIDETIATLMDEGALVEIPGRTLRYGLGAPIYRLVDEPWASRVAALNRFMTSVSRTVHGRIFASDPDSFVRTLTFRVPEDKVDELQTLYRQLFETISALDAEVTADESSPNRTMTLSVLWTPDEDHPIDTEKYE